MSNKGNGARQREPERAQVALQEYLAMGPARSLEKLRRHCADVDPENVLSMSTMKYWSSRYGWVARAVEHDARVAEAVQNKTSKRQVKQTVDALSTVDRMIVGLAGIVEQHAERETPLKLRTPQDFRAVASALTDLARAKELLEGREDSRTGHMTEAELDRELADLRRQRAALGLSDSDEAPTEH